MNEDNPTQDLSKFGYRELGMAGELLSAYAENPGAAGLGDGIALWFNTYSGNVFLTDDDYNVAMMNGDSLEPFYSCPECGNEGFYEEVTSDDHNRDKQGCREWLEGLEAEHVE